MKKENDLGADAAAVDAAGSIESLELSHAARLAKAISAALARGDRTRLGTVRPILACAVNAYRRHVMASVCRWRFDDDDLEGESWFGSCGARWVFTDGTPKANNMRFCPECGMSLKIENVTPVTSEIGSVPSAAQE